MLTSDTLARERRFSSEDPSVPEHFRGGRFYFDTRRNVRVVKIFAGDCYVCTQGNEMLSTVLGSCVSVCIRDPARGVGGMNHFMLPGESKLDGMGNAAARYGLFAMESLINGVLCAGGRKEALEVKVFGGGNVIRNTRRIGSQNAAFIRAFLLREGYHITSEDLEGEHPRRVNYFPDTGKVLICKLRRTEDMIVLDEEVRYRQQVSATASGAGGIELF